MDAPPRRSLRGTLAWAGLAGGGEEIEGRAVVVSPHLDDAVLSLGAAIARAAARGAEVTVLTVLAGDPQAPDVAPGAWDEAAGFAEAAAAAAARREEDRTACGLLGARPQWLPYWDLDYGVDRPTAQVRADVRAALGDAGTVLVPGWPLWHPDHLWVTELAIAETPAAARLGVYVEQPYAMWELRPEGPIPTDGAGRWRRLNAALRDRLSKRRAVQAYATQLPLLGESLHRHLAVWEARRGGEHVAWLEAVSPEGRGGREAGSSRT
jgi:LmbE family N-acetylglucosaminyl deacetylase